MRVRSPSMPRLGSRSKVYVVTITDAATDVYAVRCLWLCSYSGMDQGSRLCQAKFLSRRLSEECRMMIFKAEVREGRAAGRCRNCSVQDPVRRLAAVRAVERGHAPCARRSKRYHASLIRVSRISPQRLLRVASARSATWRSWSSPSIAQTVVRRIILEPACSSPGWRAGGDQAVPSGLLGRAAHHLARSGVWTRPAPVPEAARADFVVVPSRPTSIDVGYGPRRGSSRAG